MMTQIRGPARVGHPDAVRGREGQTGQVHTMSPRRLNVTRVALATGICGNVTVHSINIYRTLFISQAVCQAWGLVLAMGNNKVFPDFSPRERIRDVVSLAQADQHCVCRRQASTWTVRLDGGREA